MKTFLIYFINLCIFFILLSLWGFYWAIRPLKITSSTTPNTFGIKYEKISFHTKDNIEIKGWFIPSSKPHAKTIILLHGYPADKGNILQSRIFLYSDYNLLFIDFRYFGESGGHYSTAGKNEVLDVLAAIDYLHSRGVNEVGIWGFSLGGSVALMTAAQSPAVKAVVAEAGYARLDWLTYEYYRIPLLRYPFGQLTRFWAWIFFGYDLKSVAPSRAVEDLTIPVLLIHSKNDEVVSFRHALLLQEALKNDKKVEVLFSNTEHNGIFKDYEKIVKSFFDRNL